MIRTPGAGQDLFRRFERVTTRFLDVVLDFVGEIPEDDYLRRAVRAQRTVADAYPSSTSAQAFRKFATKAAAWPIPKGPRGNLEFFVERLVQPRAVQLEAVQ
jgi:flagellar biosynthesis protein FlhG